MDNYKKGTLERRYNITKANGKPLDIDAEYFVLRIDKDPHARVALRAYANSVRSDNTRFASDLECWLENGLRGFSDEALKDMGFIGDSSAPVEKNIEAVKDLPFAISTALSNVKRRAEFFKDNYAQGKYSDLLVGYAQEMFDESKILAQLLNELFDSIHSAPVDSGAKGLKGSFSQFAIKNSGGILDGVGIDRVFVSDVWKWIESLSPVEKAVGEEIKWFEQPEIRAMLDGHEYEDEKIRVYAGDRMSDGAFTDLCDAVASVVRRVDSHPVLSEKEIEMPWRDLVKLGWSIVGMNHYNLKGIKHLFVAMTNKEGRCIHQEGSIESDVWSGLFEKAKSFSTPPNEG